jgi:hypothetical protein
MRRLVHWCICILAPHAVVEKGPWTAGEDASGPGAGAFFVAGQQRQELRRRERGEGAGGVAGPASRHQVVRAGLPGGGHLHGVFEVAVGRGQSSAPFSFAAATFTQCRAGGGAWEQGTSVTVDAQGETRVEYRSQDVDGNLEAPAKACMVRTQAWKHVRFSGKHVLRLNTRSLPAGAYTVKLRATDTAGNRQAKPTRVKPVIRK